MKLISVPPSKTPNETETKYLHKFADFAGKRVIEIGCGDGRLTWQYAKSARLVAGIDLEANDLRLATIDRPSDFGMVRSLSRTPITFTFPFPKKHLILLSLPGRSDELHMRAWLMP